MVDKTDLLKKIYFNKAGFGSIKTTYDDAKKKNKSITRDDVKDFFKEYVEQKKQLRGYNSFIAPYANYEYQVDLFFINDLPNQPRPARNRTRADARIPLLRVAAHRAVGGVAQRAAARARLGRAPAVGVEPAAATPRAPRGRGALPGRRGGAHAGALPRRRAQRRL